MSHKRYSRNFKIEVAKEALRPEMKENEHLIAAKYEVRESTVLRWRSIYEKYGREGFNKTFQTKQREQELLDAQRQIDILEEQVEILKKTAVLIAKAKQE